jgi:predicted transcriptional regulator
MTQAKIRDILAQVPDGMTTKQLAVKLNVDQASVSRSLKLMRDVYIDRWQKTTSRYSAVHCLASIPEDCPHP